MIGDSGSLYVEEPVAIAMRDSLIPTCDIATPNLFEASWLTGLSFEQRLEDVHRITQSISIDKVLITSCPGKTKGTLGNVYSDPSNLIGAFHPTIPNAPNGPGDLSAALFLGHTLSNQPPEVALEKTTASVFEILSGSSAQNSGELTLAAGSASIRNPGTAVELVRLN